MTTLIVFSATSRAFVDLALQAIHRGKTIVVDTGDDLHAQLKALGVSSIPLRGVGPQDWKSRDMAFREKAMPGNLTENFPETELPIWKVLSIDRLNFWFKPAAAFDIETVLALDWDELLVPLDLRHSLPWTLARLKPSIAVQTQPIRTREWADLFIAGQVPFKEMIAWNQKDANFISGFTQTPTSFHECGDWQAGSPVTPQERKSLRAAMNIPEGSPTALVLFESQTEWEFRTCLPQLMQNYIDVLIYPVTAIDRKNLAGLGIVSGNRIRVIDDLSVEPVADEVVTFRFNDDLNRGRRLPVKVLDITNRWLSRELSQ